MFVNDYIPGPGSGVFLLGALAVLIVMLFLCLLRLILGPDAQNRILAINMTCGVAVAAIAVVSLLLGEPALLDVALVYCLISFLAVVILSQIYISVIRRQRSDGTYKEETSARTRRRAARENRRKGGGKGEEANS